MPTHPALACGLVLGNVAPDLDAFSRLGGKHAFLRFHQTYTHSVAAIFIPLVIAGWLWMLQSEVWWQLAFGFAVGMAMHVGLDLTNSYGVRCLWPFSSKRFALDWIFFIDAPVLLLTTTALILAWMAGTNENQLRVISIVFIALLLLTVVVRGLISGRARRFALNDGTGISQTTVIPTTWSPFRFLVCQKADRGGVAFCLNAITGSKQRVERIQTLDDAAPAAILQTVEWKVMRELSPHYHVVQRSSLEGIETFVCRDLRIRNFDTKFGTLTCRVDQDGQIISKKWDV